MLDSREVSHPAYPDAVVQAPGLVAVDASREDVYTQECFGPVAFLIATASTDQSLAQLARHRPRARRDDGSGLLDRRRRCSRPPARRQPTRGVALSENLTGQIFVNQTAAFSDYHGTGANPAANAAYVDAAFVANRFRVVTSRRHV